MEKATPHLHRQRLKALPFMHPGHYEDCRQAGCSADSFGPRSRRSTPEWSCKRLIAYFDPHRAHAAGWYWRLDGGKPSKGQQRPEYDIGCHPCNRHAAAGDSHSADLACARKEQRKVRVGPKRVTSEYHNVHGADRRTDSYLYVSHDGSSMMVSSMSSRNTLCNHTCRRASPLSSTTLVHAPRSRSGSPRDCQYPRRQRKVSNCVPYPTPSAILPSFLHGGPGGHHWLEGGGRRAWREGGPKCRQITAYLILPRWSTLPRWGFHMHRCCPRGYCRL